MSASSVRRGSTSNQLHDDVMAALQARKYGQAIPEAIGTSGCSRRPGALFTLQASYNSSNKASYKRLPLLPIYVVNLTDIVLSAYTL